MQGSKIECQPLSCHTDLADCTLQDGVRNCYCHEGYEGDGTTCEGDITISCICELDSKDVCLWNHVLVTVITKR